MQPTQTIALWARRGTAVHPRLHRASGYAWISMMIASALSSVLIHDYALPNFSGYAPIHLLVPVTLVGLGFAFWAVVKQKYIVHRKTMQTLYWLACVVPGACTLLPDHLLGKKFLDALG